MSTKHIVAKLVVSSGDGEASVEQAFGFDVPAHANLFMDYVIEQQGESGDGWRWARLFVQDYRYVSQAKAEFDRQVEESSHD